MSERPLRARQTRQQRSFLRQEAMRTAAARLLIDEGPAAVTHRRVAEAAGVPAGSANYYFPERDGLYAEAVEAAEEIRGQGAHEYAEGLTRRRRSPERTAQLLIETFYAPHLDPDVVPVRLEPMLSATRAPGLAEIMSASRPRLIEALRVVLGKSGYEAIAEGEDVALLAMMIDASLLYASASADRDPVRFATASLARLIELAGR